MSENDQALECLKEIQGLLTVGVRILIAPLLNAELADAQLRQLYELTGNATQSDICRKLSMSATTVSEKWKRWEQLGMLVKEGRSYRRTV